MSSVLHTRRPSFVSIQTKTRTWTPPCSQRWWKLTSPCARSPHGGTSTALPRALRRPRPQRLIGIHPSHRQKATPHPDPPRQIPERPRTGPRPSPAHKIPSPSRAPSGAPPSHRPLRPTVMPASDSQRTKLDAMGKQLRSTTGVRCRSRSPFGAFASPRQPRTRNRRCTTCQWTPSLWLTSLSSTGKRRRPRPHLGVGQPTPTAQISGARS
mmetsp:Transcript_4903/g.8960  ORF Transcript_4903/g.8960 Transcript_4903/m.8960 type:complete len:211 (+) Transcript_4903:85-717(+)